MNKKLFYEIAGWYGTVAILAAYALVSFGWLQSDGILYQLLNLTGGIGIIIVSASKKVYQSVVLNIIWGAIAIIAILGILF